MIYWLTFVLLSSILEAYIFHKNKFKYKYKHHIMTAIRIIVCAPAAYLNNVAPIFILFGVLSFPFLHDGIYYTTRNLLNPKVYQKKWWDRSTTSNAIFNLSIFWRILLFVFSLGLLPLIILNN